VTREIPDAAKLLVVKLEREEQTADVLRVLGRLGIPTEVMGVGVRVWRSGTVVVQIPADRLPEAMLALGLQGFSDLRAYGREVLIERGSRGPRSRRARTDHADRGGRPL
jgi:hypothetical protein